MTTGNDKSNHMGAAGAPLYPLLPVRGFADIRWLEETPLEEALTVRSTYELFRNSGAAFGDKTALTFLRTGNPADEPIRRSYAQLLAGIRTWPART
jgi:fatty-acyl-CoA synthase